MIFDGELYSMKPSSDDLDNHRRGSNVSRESHDPQTSTCTTRCKVKFLIIIVIVTIISVSSVTYLVVMNSISGSGGNGTITPPTELRSPNQNGM